MSAAKEKKKAARTAGVQAPKEEKETKAKEAPLGLQSEVNIGMVGHVDAGKTSLVEALTGVWVDTHSEELKRGISIRLGYADTGFFECTHCKAAKYFSSKTGECAACGKKGKLLRYISFVDAPGHETLMATMLSGAVLMHGAVLVISANETCPQPQTVEHLNALILNGIQHFVVAQTKVDLVEEGQARKNYAEIEGFLKSYGLQDKKIVPVASHFRANLSHLIRTMQEEIPSPKLDAGKPLKMYCARSFDINKPGTEAQALKGGVVGGTILEGVAKAGQKIEISPGIDGKTMVTEITSLHSSLGPLKEARPGGLIAIGTFLDPSLTQNDQLKGQVIAEPGSLPAPSQKVSLEVHYLERALVKTEGLKVNEPVVLTIGTMPMLGFVEELKNNWAVLALKNRAVVQPGTKIAISKKEEMKWRLVAYGTPK